MIEQQKHEAIFHTPPGVGGKGELEFIDRFKVLNSNIVLYHGTTSFLRVGDISFIKIPTLELTAIGELKTQRIGPGKLEISVSAYGRKEIAEKFFKDLNEKIKTENWTDKTKKLNSFPPKIEEKLKKQIKEILNSLAPKDIIDGEVVKKYTDFNL